MTVTTDPVRHVAASTPPSARATSTRRWTVGALLAWVSLLVIARLWGLAVVHAASGNLYLGAIPLFGTWKVLVSARLVVAASAGAVGVLVLPRIAAQWRWRAVLAATALGAVVWGGALALADGPSAWESIHEDYGQHIDRVDQSGLGGFLRDYTADQSTFPTHLQAHPPGMVVLLWAGAHAGLDNRAFDVGVALAGAAAAAVAALVVLADVAGEQHARQAAPFVVLLPAAVWHTNADAFYSGLIGVAVALVVVATGRAGAVRVRWAVIGGVMFGVALLFTYGVALLAVPVVVIAARRRALRVAVIAGCATLCVLAVPALWGFSWLEGLDATRRQYDLNLIQVRPTSYFWFANLAVFALALGPATAVAFTRLRDRRAWFVVGAGLAVVLLADASGLSAGETERIWQPFMPMVVLAGCALADRARPLAARPWLGLQVITAIGLQVALRSPW